MNRKIEQHSFSIEIKTEGAVKKMTYLDKNNGVFFEGFLGELKSVKMVEDVMLEIEGNNGTVRLDITQKEMEQILEKQTIQNGDKQQ